MKKKIITGLLSLGFLLTGCGVISKTAPELNIKGTNNEVEEKLVTQVALGFSNININNNRKNAQRNFTDQEVLDIQKVLSQVDVFLSKDTTLKVKKSIITTGDYANLMQLSFDGQSISLYYNNEETKSRKTTDEVTTINTFSGVALYNNYEYEFKFIDEVEKGFGEYEAKTTLVIYESGNTFVEISQESEEEYNEKEVSYSYKKVVDQKLILDFELSIKNERGIQEVEVDINDVEYSFEYVTIANKEYIKVELENRQENETKGYFEKVFNKNEDGIVTSSFVLVNI